MGDVAIDLIYVLRYRLKQWNGEKERFNIVFQLTFTFYYSVVLQSPASTLEEY